MKGSSGAVGLTENPSAFRKWMLAGPEQARMLKEFEASLSEGSEMHYHHEEGLSTQQSLRGQVLSLAKTISDMGNPFMNDTAKMLMLDTCDVMIESVTNTVRIVENLERASMMNTTSQFWQTALDQFMTHQEKLPSALQVSNTKGKIETSWQNSNFEG